MKQSGDNMDQSDSSGTRNKRSCDLENCLYQHDKKRMRAVGPYCYKVSEAAQHDESPKLDDNPPKWKHVREADKIDKLQRNGKVRQGNEKVTGQLPPSYELQQAPILFTIAAWKTWSNVQELSHM